MSSADFLALIGILPLLARLVVGTVEGVAALVRTIQAIGASPEQQAALLTVAHEAVRAEQARVKASPRLDPNQPDQLLPAAP